jgi:hypothetical protein
MISKEFIVNLRGKEYPLWAGVLDAATRAGLKSLTTKVIQIPSADNGQLAVVMATAVFDDGRVFEDVGDCSPQSTAPHLAAAALRLASTRAKGRCLRDAINVGQTMFEELPDDERVEKPNWKAQEPGTRPSDAPRGGPPVTAGEGTQNRCYDCGADLTQGQVKLGIATYGLPLCPTHQRDHPRLDAK